VGSYGVDCEWSCECRGSTDCHPVTGQCVCTAGWTGYACQHSTTCSLLCVDSSDGVKDMTHEAKAKAMTHKAKAKAKDLTCHAALKPQT